MWKIVRGLVAASLSLAAQLEVIIGKGGGRLLLKMQLNATKNLQGFSSHTFGDHQQRKEIHPPTTEKH